MTELDKDAPKRPSAKDTFRNNGVCVTTGYACEMRHDCREYNVPVAMGQIEIANAIRACKCGCEGHDGKEE